MVRPLVSSLTGPLVTEEHHAAVAASVDINMVANPGDGNYFFIRPAPDPPIAFIFVTEPAHEGDVQIGVTFTETLANLIVILNVTNGIPITASNPSGTILRITANVVGAAGNAIAVASDSGYFTELTEDVPLHLVGGMNAY